MKSRIGEKLKQIQEGIEELESFLPESPEEYMKDPKIRAACERAFEKVMEAVIDTNLLVIKFKRMEMPNDDSSTFTLLEKHKFLPSNLVKKLLDAKGMRNFIVHQYDKIDDELVYEALTESLPKDIGEFIREIKKKI
ncbi:DUF86 domain-containing protein [Candidatus Woesearchaeota archaeon]|nr:DUF86 domain-containing protein [Candidatus Woesearchaeota archaeon]